MVFNLTLRVLAAPTGSRIGVRDDGGYGHGNQTMSWPGGSVAVVPIWTYTGCVNGDIYGQTLGAVRVLPYPSLTAVGAAREGLDALSSYCMKKACQLAGLVTSRC